MISIDNTMSDVEQMKAVTDATAMPDELETQVSAKAEEEAEDKGTELESKDTGTDDEGEDGDEAGEETAGDKKKRPGSQVRKHQVLILRERVAELERRLSEGIRTGGERAAEREAQPEIIQGEPTLDEFDGDLQKFAKAQVKWEMAQEKAQEQSKVRADTWKAKSAEAAKEIPDFNDYAEVNIPLNQQMRDFILDSEIGPKLAYTLAKDLEEAQRIFGLPPLKQVKELAKLEIELTGSTTPPVKQLTKASAAPPPIKPLAGGTSAPVVKDPYKQPLSFAEYNAWRNSGGK
jgi:hypothetical protein